MSSVFVFDCDGVLWDSKTAVKKAYAIAGVDMPDDAWGKPWQDWLDDGRLHAMKQTAYDEMILDGDVAVLPPAQLARDLRELGFPVKVLTGASYTAMSHLMAFHGLNRCGIRVLGHSCPENHKRSKLHHLTDEYESVTYIDDTTWAHPPHDVNFIHYIGQDLSYLLESVAA